MGNLALGIGHSSYLAWLVLGLSSFNYMHICNTAAAVVSALSSKDVRLKIQTTNMATT